MAREDLHFRLRIPEDLKKRIEAHADLNNRSMTAEIISRLEESLNNERGQRIDGAMVQDLKLQLASEQGKNAAFQNGLHIMGKHLIEASKGAQVSIKKVLEEIASTSVPSKDKT